MKRTLSALAIVIMVLVACKEQPKPAPPKQQGQKARPAVPQSSPESVTAPVEKKPVAPEGYTYEPKGRRDPFLSIIEASKREKEAEKKKKGLKPSEAYDVRDIKVIAIAKDRKRYYAMIQLPDKKYFTIREGMTLGMYGGKVISINDNGVTVREFVKNYKGEIQPRDTILKLRKEEGE